MTPARTMLLVHSPLLTPATWDALGPRLEAAGWRVLMLDLRPLVETPSLHDAVCAAAAELADDAPAAIVGHSRAGAYLPGIAEAVGGDRLDVVFLDARLPYPGESWAGSLSPEQATSLRQMARSGRLPAWDTWFPPDSLPELLPDARQRRRVLGNLPELPWRVLCEVLPTPGGAWDSARRSYLQLSDPYRPMAVEATERGYRVERLDADHLAMVTQPEAVTKLILSTLSR